MPKITERSLLVLLTLLVLPSAAFAQAALTGVVKDASGAVLPGVTVEAASPVLIEKVRSVVSDGTGQYRIVNLLPGTYSVTFSLPGFSTAKREGIELSGTFVATINGELKVGALEETITVTGETPIVDVQSAKTQQTISKDLVAAIPTSRVVSAVVKLVPGVMTQTDVGGTSGQGSGAAGATGSIHGGRPNDSRLLNDGITTGYNGGGSGMFMANVGGATEVVLSTSGGLGEAEVGGTTLNVIPRDGGNSYSGSAFFTFANTAMQGNNFSQTLKDQGLTARQQIVRLYDINPMGGGRIIRDRLWFYNQFRAIRADNTVPGMYYNKNAGDVTKWTYDADLSRQAYFDQISGSGSARLTWQVSPRNKLTAYWDAQWKWEAVEGGGTPTQAPEAAGRTRNTPSNFHQLTYSAPLTSRVLIDGSYGQPLMTYRSGGSPRPGVNPVLINATEQAGAIPNISYRAVTGWSQARTGTRTWRAAVSYVPGAHSMKFGYFGGYSTPYNDSYQLPCPQCAFGEREITSIRFNNGTPNQITFVGALNQRNARSIIPTSFYGQDQWTQGRLTLQGGVRYDYLKTSYPELRVGGTRLVPTEFVFPAGSVEGVHFHDITPRVGVAYDLFGTGKTALKFNLGKYPVSVRGTDFDTSPLGRINVSTTRSWTDTNKNMVQDCDLVSRAKNGECGAMTNQNFGRDVVTTNFDPNASSGWGNRQYQWDMGSSIQQALTPRVSVSVGYYRRWYGNFTAVDNLSTTPSDFDRFSVTAPADSRLPNGGGNVVTDLYNVKPSLFGISNNLVVPTSDFGNQIEYWHGVDVNLDARFRNGLTLRGGTSTGRRVTDNCEIRAKLPETAPLDSYCRVTEPFLTSGRASASYTVPRLDVLLSTSFTREEQGIDNGATGAIRGLAANWAVPNAVVKTSLGRDLSGSASSATVNLIAPATRYAPRLTYLDFRVAKVLRYSRTRAQVGIDIYNIFNADTPQTYNQTYVQGGSWLTPQTILPARFLKVSAQIDF